MQNRRDSVCVCVCVCCGEGERPFSFTREGWPSGEEQIAGEYIWEANIHILSKSEPLLILSLLYFSNGRRHETNISCSNHTKYIRVQLSTGGVDSKIGVPINAVEQIYRHVNNLYRSIQSII